MQLKSWNLAPKSRIGFTNCRPGTPMSMEAHPVGYPGPTNCAGHTFSPSSVTRNRGGGCKRNFFYAHTALISSCVILLLLTVAQNSSFHSYTFFHHYVIFNKIRPLKFPKGRPLKGPNSHFKGKPGTDVSFVPL